MSFKQLSLIALCISAGACQSLGNPERNRTPPSPWRGDTFQTQTSSITRNGADARAFVEHLVASDFDYVDDRVRQAPHLTVVNVIVASQTNRKPPYPLRTEFRFDDGSSIARDWAAVRGQVPKRAVFLLSRLPITATTAVLTR